MYKTKLLTGILLVLAVLIAQVGTVFAAPAAQDTTTTTLTGTVTGIKTTDANGVTTVVVTLVDDGGKTHIVGLDPVYAASLGLVTLSTDATTGAQVVTPVLIDPAIPLTVAIDTAMVLSQEAVHPIAAILATFFSTDAGAVDDLHEEGFGFGVIAQALWMEKNIALNELSTSMITAEMILQAKKNNDFSSFSLTDGTTFSNWGQFRKAVLDKKNNLGLIVSGHAENDGTQSALQQNKGNSKNKDKKPGKGNNKNP